MQQCPLVIIANNVKLSNNLFFYEKQIYLYRLYKFHKVFKNQKKWIIDRMVIFKNYPQKNAPKIQ